MHFSCEGIGEGVPQKAQLKTPASTDGPSAQQVPGRWPPGRCGTGGSHTHTHTHTHTKTHATKTRRQLACARIGSAEGQNYLKAMACAANYAWVNRSSMTFLARQVGCFFWGGGFCGGILRGARRRQSLAT